MSYDLNFTSSSIPGSCFIDIRKANTCSQRMWSHYLAANVDDIFCFMKRFPRVWMETAGGNYGNLTISNSRMDTCWWPRNGILSNIELVSLIRVWNLTLQGFLPVHSFFFSRALTSRSLFRMFLILTEDKCQFTKRHKLSQSAL